MIPRRDRARARVEPHPPSEDLAHGVKHVLKVNRHAQGAICHGTASRVGHLGVLQVERRRRESVQTPGMVVVQVGEDDIPHLGGGDPRRRQRIPWMAQQRPPAPGSGLRPEPGINDDLVPATQDCPDVVVDWHG